MSETKNFVIRLDKETHHKFRIKLAENIESAQVAIEKFIKEYIKNDKKAK